MEELILTTVETIAESKKRLKIAPSVATHIQLVDEVLRLSMVGFDFPPMAMAKLSQKTKEQILTTIDQLVAERKLLKVNAINECNYQIA